MTSKAKLTHALVVMKDPAGFAVEAFVVLRPCTFLTRVVASYKDEETVGGSVSDELRQN